jgi:iron complex outermembrane receptor protein
MINKKRKLWGATGIAISALAASQAYAQSSAAPAAANSNDTAYQDIIVTAERRETRLQETPVAITVVSGEQLANKQINSVMDIGAALPSVQIGAAVGQVRIAIRGVSFTDLRAGAEGRIAFYTDGVYNGQPSAQFGSFFDIERVEVLRGPQGTLFGRNATGGAFVVTSRKPTDTLSGYLNATIGNFETRNFDGALSGPLTDTLSARLAFKTVDHGGYGRNRLLDEPINDENSQSVRLTLKWEPSDRFDATLIGHYFREDDHGSAPTQFGQAVPVTTRIPLPPFCTPEQYTAPNCILINSRDTTAYYSSSNRRRQKGVNLILNYEINDWLSAKSILAAEYSWYELRQTNAGVPNFINRNKFSADGDQYSGEFQLLGDLGRLNFVVGAFYFDDKISPMSLTAVPAAFYVTGAPYQMVQGFHSAVTLKTKSLAFYGQATYEITDALSLTLGGRYTRERKHAVNNFSGTNFTIPWPLPFTPTGYQLNPANPGFPNGNKLSYNTFNPRVTLDFKFAPGIFAYATYSSGFKSGGFNWGQVAEPYPEEKITNYELGLKTTTFNGALIANLSAFYYDYSNIQTQVVGGVVPSVQTRSVGKAAMKGVELEFTAKPVRQFQIDGAVSILDAKYRGDTVSNDVSRPQLGLLPLRGNWAQGAPRYTINAGAEYRFDIAPGSLTLRGEYRRTGKVDWSIFNLDTLRTRPYEVGNAFLRFEDNDGKWTATAYVRNIGNTFAPTTLFQQSNTIGAIITGSALEPRTYGVTLGYKF